MAAQKNSKKRILLLAGLLLLIVVATLAINLPQFFYGQALYLPIRIALPAFLVAGFFGSILRSKPLRFAGWMGICYFFPLSLSMAWWDEDYFPAGRSEHLRYPPADGGAGFLLRLVLMLVLSVSLIVCYRKLAKT
jgi:hypothetical protein